MGKIASAYMAEAIGEGAQDVIGGVTQFAARKARSRQAEELLDAWRELRGQKQVSAEDQLTQLMTDPRFTKHMKGKAPEDLLGLLLGEVQARAKGEAGLAKEERVFGREKGKIRLMGAEQRKTKKAGWIQQMEGLFAKLEQGSLEKQEDRRLKWAIAKLNAKTRKAIAKAQQGGSKEYTLAQALDDVRQNSQIAQRAISLAEQEKLDLTDTQIANYQNTIDRSGAILAKHGFEKLGAKPPESKTLEERYPAWKKDIAAMRTAKYGSMTDEEIEEVIAEKLGK